MTQTDGKLLLGGSEYHTPGYLALQRFNPDGSEDVDFHPTFADAGETRISQVILQPDGKIVVGAYLLYLNVASSNRVLRLHSEGSSDTTFALGKGANDRIMALLQQPDGRIVIGGRFTRVDELNRNRIARLSADGVAEAAFDSGEGFNLPVKSLAQQPDGKIFVGGEFTLCNRTSRNRVARLNGDGSLDLGFDPGLGANGPINLMALGSDGGLLVAGVKGSVPAIVEFVIDVLAPLG